MIAIMDLRPGNYIHPPATDDAQLRYLRVVSIDLISKTVTAKADFSNEPETFDAAAINGCALDALTAYMGGLSFDEHSLLIGAETVSIIAAGGAAIELPHIRYVHQFQNLFRSLTGQELPFNLAQ